MRHTAGYNLLNYKRT